MADDGAANENPRQRRTATDPDTSARRASGNGSAGEPATANGRVENGAVGGGSAQGDGIPAERRQEDDLHPRPTRMERLRGWVESMPKRKLYLSLSITTWLLLTLLVGIDPREVLAGRQQDYEVGSIAERDVYAGRSVYYPDPVATELARDAARDRAGEVYRLDRGVSGRKVEAVSGFFDAVRGIRNSDAPNEEKIGQVIGAAPFYLPESAARSLIFLSDGQVDEAERYVTENLRELYRSTAVADDSLTQPPAAVVPLSEARARLSEAAQRDASGELGTVVEVLSRGFLEPNYVVDREATERIREKAAAGVQPVRGEVQTGERVVARGEVVDAEDLARLQALGVVSGGNSWSVFFGVALVIATEMWISFYFLERFGRRILKGKAAIRVVLAALLVVLFTAVARGVVLLGLPAYLIPLPGLSMIGTILLGPRLMFLMVVVSAVNVGIIAENDFFLASALLLTSGFAIYAVLRRVGPRTELLWAGLFVAAVSGVVALAVGLIAGGGLRVALTQGGLGLANGFLSLMLAMVLLPLLETAFNILTPMKLLELSDQTNPLLSKLLRGAPGTFTHSMTVGNLAENAAQRVGADPLLARVGSYYHDIGKLEHPGYYIENQFSKVNPHEALTPALSAKIIKRHVKDGLRIGREWNLPKEILDLIAQHHGTTRIEYFYRKALEGAAGRDLAGPDVREEDFRYSGPRPRSKEAGILMLADSVEATVKSLEKPTPKRIEDIVNNTIRHKLEDGQFDECELTMREIRATGEAIREALIGFLGPRIEYPGGPAPGSPKVRRSVKTRPAAG
jgi:putative nucleotidyltransferase with HDIG domain